MGDFKAEIKSTFDGKNYNVVPVKTKRQDGFDQKITVYIEENGNELVLVNQNDDVVARIIGDSLTIIPVD